MSRSLRPARIWAAPVALGLVSAVGLVSALLADGLGDAVSWLALGAPVAVGLWYALLSDRER